LPVNAAAAAAAAAAAVGWMKEKESRGKQEKMNQGVAPPKAPNSGLREK
jgi:hypothetical protein